MMPCLLAYSFAGLLCILSLHVPAVSAFHRLSNFTQAAGKPTPVPPMLRFQRRARENVTTGGSSDDRKVKFKKKSKKRTWRQHNNTEVNTPLCTPVLPQSTVLSFTAGLYERCAVVTSPAKPVTEPVPVLFWFHAAGGQANRPQCMHWSQMGLQKKFAVVCAEALQGVFSRGGGFWSLPEVVTDDTGNKCNYNRSAITREPGDIDMQYVMTIIDELQRQPRVYDLTRLFFAGCSMGSHFTMYVSNCIKQEYPKSVSAFATHSSGLKVRGDGLEFPFDVYNPEYRWGECPGCQYAPIKPRRFHDPLGLKACVFDNTGDSSDFYWSSVNLAEEWSRLGNKVELHALSPGAHCEIKDYEEIWHCLDDGTGRLQGTEVAPAADTKVLMKTPSHLLKPRTPQGSKSSPRSRRRKSRKSKKIVKRPAAKHDAASGWQLLP